MDNRAIVVKIEQLIDQVEKEYDVTMSWNSVERRERLRKLAQIINNLNSAISKINQL